MEEVEWERTFASNVDVATKKWKNRTHIFTCSMGTVSLFSFFLSFSLFKLQKKIPIAKQWQAVCRILGAVVLNCTCFYHHYTRDWKLYRITNWTSFYLTVYLVSINASGLYKRHFGALSLRNWACVCNMYLW